MKVLFKTPRQREISEVIDPGMIEAWLTQQADIWEIYFLCKRRAEADWKFSEFADVFLLIAEHY